ncbi:SIR2 family protein [Mucilaginibacter arboris]|uniref:SIR2-like domain-containing protein n=1 Tax=Mucilaginibacter arboris TaxID=2682090 RepID=A0A7K1SYI9_9SPHI|nr:SIR2 family protein [Mucilaginibacter arboris]MVN22382.1 hypothetical protein [Mucilaginibacter arboris]
MVDELVKHLTDVGNLPYLFVGSGFSRRYIGMENWQDLLENVCKQINLPRPFPYYLTESNKDYPLLGRLISDAFYESFYELDYKTQYPYISDEILKWGNKDTPLKYVISNYIGTKSLLPKHLIDEIEELKKIKVAGVITTNWDCFLEEIFIDFKTYIGQEMMFAETLNFGEIFKIHGCSSKPDSLVLTSRDYVDYNNRNAYLTAKLLTIFVEHPIVFLGYSLSDPNILNIINSVFQCIQKENYDKFKDRLIFVEYDDSIIDPTFMDGTLPIGNGIFLPIKHIKTKDFSAIYTALQKMEQTIPTKLLVRLKDMFYEFVVSNKPGDKMYIDVNNIDYSKLDNIQAAFGFGVADIVHDYGYRSISPKDILTDILSDSNLYVADKLLTSTYSQIIGNIEYFPIYKYLKATGVTSLNDLKTQYPSFSDIVLSRLKKINFNKLMPGSGYVAHKPKVNLYNDLDDLIKNEDISHVLIYLHLLDHSKINLITLQSFLNDNFDKYYNKTDFRKAICLYDILKYS